MNSRPPTPSTLHHADGMYILTPVQEQAVKMFVGNIKGRTTYNGISVIKNSAPIVNYVKKVLVFNNTSIALKSGITPLRELTQEVIFELMLILDDEEFSRYCIASTVIQRIKEYKEYNESNGNMVLACNYDTVMQTAKNLVIFESTHA